MTDHRHPCLPPAHLEDLVHHLPARSLNVLLLRQAAASCPDCASLWETSQRPQETTPEERLAHHLGLDPSDDTLAAKRTESWDLRELAPDDRLPAIERSPIRFRSPVLVVVLLTRTQQSLRSSPSDALELATMAATVAEYGTKDPALTALGLAYIGNVHRTSGRLDLAGPYFDQALEHLQRAPDPPLWLRAELRSLQASLMMDHRHFKDVELHLLNAAAMFKAAGDRERVVRVRLNLAAFHHLTGEPDRALDASHETLRLLNPWRFPQLHLSALHNHALYLSEAQKPHLARHLIELAEPLYASYSSTSTRRDWLLGLIASALDEPRTAEQHFRASLAQFIEGGSPVYAALVAVDLAELLLEEGRSHEVVEVTKHLPGLFRSLEVHPEAVAATLLFHKAAAEQKVTEEYVTLFRGFLERTQVDRSASFAPPPV